MQNETTKVIQCLMTLSLFTIQLNDLCHEVNQVKF